LLGREAISFLNEAADKYQFPLPADPETLRGIMEGLIFFSVLIIGGIALAPPIAAFIIARKARRQAEEVEKQVGFLREQNVRLKERIERLESAHKSPRVEEAPAVEAASKFTPAAAPREIISAKPADSVTAPVIEKPSPPPIPKSAPAFVKTSEPPTPLAPAPSRLNLEQFMGAKLFAWIGGLALFLFGMDLMTAAVKRAAGDHLKDLLGKVTRNRFLGAFVGAVVTGLVNSSTVTTVILVGFISAGLMSMAQSVRVIMGANIGSTVTAQILAFNVTRFALPMIALGFLVAFGTKKENWREYGRMLLETMDRKHIRLDALVVPTLVITEPWGEAAAHPRASRRCRPRPASAVRADRR